MNQALPGPFSESDLWPEESKLWFTWSDNQRLLADELADDVEKLYTSCLYCKHCGEEIRRFYKAKAVYDTKKAFGEYVNPAKDPWPFEPNNPRECNLPDDLSALYTILARFHDWMPGRRSITSSTDGPAQYEFMTGNWVNMTSYGAKREASTWGGLEQRQVNLSELQTFFDHMEKALLKQFPGRWIDKVTGTIVRETAKKLEPQQPTETAEGPIKARVEFVEQDMPGLKPQEKQTENHGSLSEMHQPKEASDGKVESKTKITKNEANLRVRELLRETPTWDWTTRKLAKQIPCFLAWIPYLPAWRAYHEKRKALRHTGTIDTVSLTKNLEAVLGAGEKDEVLKQLIAEQAKDDKQTPRLYGRNHS